MRVGSVQRTIEQLRADGYRVDITQLRTVMRLDRQRIGRGEWREERNLQERFRIREWGPGYRIGTRGGKVVVRVYGTLDDGKTPDENRVWTASAECSDKDAFNGKLGAAIALGRVVKAMRATE